MGRTIEENKKLCKEMPYLKPRNVWTGEPLEDYDYSWIEGDYDLPVGWHKLFLQMCVDIKEPLERSGELDNFYFTQVKEKYGTLRAYCSPTTQEVLDILNRYEYVSEFVCEGCGKPATKVTRGWIVSVCDDCFQRELEDIVVDPITFRPDMHKVIYCNGSKDEICEDCSDIWRRLYEND